MLTSGRSSFFFISVVHKYTKVSPLEGRRLFFCYPGPRERLNLLSRTSGRLVTHHEYQQKGQGVKSRSRSDISRYSADRFLLKSLHFGPSSQLLHTFPPSATSVLNCFFKYLLETENFLSESV